MMMKYRYLLMFFLLIPGSFIKAQPPETTYLGTVVYEGYYDDRSWGPLNIGFNFTFYGNTYNHFYVTSNGLVIFGTGSNDYTEDPIPSSSTPNNFIAPFWDDIVINPSGKILYTTIGASPNRKCIIQWTNMGFYSSTVLMGTFSVILYEGSNNIRVQYRSIIDNTSARSHGSSASIGIENSTGTSGIQYAYHNSSAISSEQAILFTSSGSSYTMNSSALYDGVYLTKNISLPEPGIPKLVSPANNSTVGSSQKFEWTGSSNASYYTLKLSTNSDISGSIDYNTGTNTTFDISGLSLNTTYYWAVFATNSTGTTWSEIYRFTISSNPPLTAVPQTVWMEQNEERTIRLQFNGGDASTKSARISVLPSQGSLYQYNAGMKGSRITSVPNTITDPDLNLIYLADGGTGNGAGNFKFIIHENTDDSPEGTITVNINPPGIPNFLLAAKSGNIEIQFDKTMADPTGKEGQFIVKVNGTPVSISAVSLKPGDPYTILVTLTTPLTGSETVLISYTQGDVTAESGGLLPSFVDQPVTFVIQTISFPLLPVMTYGDPPVTLSATASSGLPVTFTSSNTAIATLSGNILTANSTGTAEITAMQIGNGTYAPARYMRILTVNKADQTITFPEPGTKVFGDPDFNPEATASSGLPVSYSSDNLSVATISGSNIHITGAGTATITASQEGNNLYYSAIDIAVTLTVSKADQTITFGAPGPVTYGDPDFNAGATASSSLNVTYASDNNDVAVITGDLIHIVNAGTTIIRASQGGDNNYNPAPDKQQTLTVNKATQTTTFPLLNSYTFGEPDFDPLATASSGLTVSYASSNPDVATISGNMIHITGAGITTITASQAGNRNYLPAPDASQNLTIMRAAQSITFSALQPAVFGDSDIDPMAVSSSGLAITYSSSNTSVAVITGNMIHITGAGSSVITASQAGDDDYLAASDVEQTLVIGKANQTINFGPLADATYGSPDINPGATATSGLEVTYSSSNPSVASIVSGLIVINGAGSIIITSSQAGNDNYYAATDIQQVLTVLKAEQTITFAPLPEVKYGDEPFSAAAIASSGLDITYSSNNLSVAVITDGMIEIKGAGTSVITASQSGNANYNPAGNISQPLMVRKADQFISFSPPGNYIYGDPDLNPAAVASSGLSVSYTSDNNNVAVVSGNTIQIVGAGSANISAYQPGDQNYNPASDITQLLIVGKADQVISFPPISPVVYGVSGFSAGASSSSGLIVTYSSDNTSVAEVINDYIYIRGVGNANIIASQSGNNNFNPAEDKQVNVVVTKAHLTITADNKTKTYLSLNPALTYTCSGFVYGENAAVLDVSPTISTEAGQDSITGDYVITVSGGYDNCYDLIYVTGTMTITKADQTVTFTAFPERLRIDETFELGAVATSGLPVLFESKNLELAQITGTTLKGLSVGNAEIRAYQPGNENYNSAETEISVEVINIYENIMHLFTPNNDGFNDLWEIPDLASYGKCEVRVYNRWGKLVFSSPDYHNEWDGTSNGVNLPSAAYYFIMKSETKGTITGTVNIVR
jgi:gliding motility-associated-like protein